MYVVSHNSSDSQPSWRHSGQEPSRTMVGLFLKAWTSWLLFSWCSPSEWTRFCDDFEAWLERSGLSEKMVKTHVDNINFFTTYLVYREPLKKLDEAASGDVWMFLVDWFPRKALWASVTSVRSYLASFKKFFRWMGETGHVSPETVTDVLDTLKEGRDEFLASVDD
jgi:hypothetical protein